MTELYTDNTYYITTPIYYPSGRLHIGNSYSTLACDAAARYQRLMGKDVFFLTGTDEHGQKIQAKAEALGIDPQLYVDQMADKFKTLWKTLEITHNKFIRTTDDYHVKAVQDIFERFLAQGDIYLGEYEGWYSVSDEEFFTETQLIEVIKDDQGKVIGGTAPSGNPVELVKEASYFFKLSNYADRLLDYYENHVEFIQPDFRKTEMINNFIKPGLEDLAVSRTSFTWGIPVKSHPDHVVYVWVDALSNYITALGYGSEDTTNFEKYWPADVHVIGKDISRFHMIYWPIFLMALDLPLPKKIYAHGWMLMKDGKMSKSKGNVIYPEILIERYGLDATRFYLLREMSQGNDTVFTPEDFINRVNFELANDLGNLLNRTVSMINRYCDGNVPVSSALREANAVDENFEIFVQAKMADFHHAMDHLAFDQALDAVMLIVSRTNKYIDETQPWVMAKEAADVKKLQGAMYHLAETLRIVAHLLRPFMPQTPDHIFQQLGLKDQSDQLLRDLAWGRFPEAVKVVEKGTPIFPRLEVEEELDFMRQAMNASATASKEQTYSVDDPDWHPEDLQLLTEATSAIAFEQFTQVDLRVAEVMDVAPVPGSNKLLRFRLDAGDEGHRQILSGIQKAYPDYEILIGKKLIIVANLFPRKMMGLISQGMILSSESDGKLQVIFADPTAANGAQVG